MARKLGDNHATQAVLPPPLFSVVAGGAVRRHALLTMALQAGGHVKGFAGPRAGVAFGACDALGVVLPVVKVRVRWQGMHALPAQGLAGENRGVRIGCRMQRGKARVIGQEVAVAVQAMRVCRHARSGPAFGPRVAGEAVHGSLVRIGVRGVAEGQGLHRPVFAQGGGVGRQVDRRQQQGHARQSDEDKPGKGRGHGGGVKRAAAVPLPPPLADYIFVTEILPYESRLFAMSTVMKRCGSFTSRGTSSL